MRPVARIIPRRETRLKLRIFSRERASRPSAAEAVALSAILADPVPVFLPGALPGDFVGAEGNVGSSNEEEEGEVVVVVVGGTAMGRTNVGLNLNASQRSSIHETQFEIMMSPRFGAQGSLRVSFAARLFDKG